MDSFIESLTASVSVINALLTAMSVRDSQDTLKALKHREALWKEKEVYISTRRQEI
jgi:DNA-binding MurR/RpiR family transcriptional regulator